MISLLIVKLGNLYSMVIVIYCILTWVPINGGGILMDVKTFFEKITEPYLNLFRKLIPPIGGVVDITPIIALLVLQFVVSFLARIL
ncbi:MAG: YggT family protein [Eggerthellaceae bacterium]